MENDMQQIDEITWRGNHIPVKVQLHNGQPVGLELILIDDMPTEFHENLNIWLRDVRIIKIGMPPSGKAYYLEDIEEYLSSEQGRAANGG